MGLVTTEHGNAGCCIDFIAYGIASASGATRGSAQRYAEGVEAWEDEGGALPGGAAMGGSPAQAAALDSAR